MREREADSVVESETQGLVNVLATLSAIEQVLLDILHDREENTAGLVDHGVHAIGASSPLDGGS